MGARKWLLPSDPLTFARGRATFVVIALYHISGLEKSGHVNKPRGHMSSIHPLDKITDPQKTNTEESQIRAQGAGTAVNLTQEPILASKPLFKTASKSTSENLLKYASRIHAYKSHKVSHEVNAFHRPEASSTH